MKIIHDPIEKTQKYLAVIEGVENEAEKEVFEKYGRKSGDGMMGYGSLFWPIKKRILLERYQIEWKTPHEMNPNTFFD